MTTAERPALLLVEDDSALGPLISELLEPDFSVHLAVNGRDGLHLALTQSWDAMVIDRGLPVMDGIALIKALRAKGIATPILILTALGATDEKIRGLDAGANDYMSKPFDAMELAARLRALTRTYALPPQTLGIGDWEFDAGARSVRSVYGSVVTLTAKEAGSSKSWPANPSVCLPVKTSSTPCSTPRTSRA
ncbi:response regulator transcription factor [Arthrobacter bambusae]|uniref:Two-component system response regulator QseB n=1 Tax=Arthrobacter bambusae TaxID=1338426 RepID=A0AAW8DKS2_9MICC|nr:response regulator transcription factor [Arthrobacter bambusae]MDP9906586.1 two-component system response regulator QseB [Arthrobacter bambusae]MDQ0129976.1 two-component system response regulator QseB [Arthrobacter bambusae]MDQ0181356.1 two-component system response regulator QseB [Arthrobacter bambusae]